MVIYDNKGWAQGDGRHQYNIGEAVRMLREGRCVERLGWNGKGMYLIMRPQDPNSGRLPQADLINAHGKRVAWNASQEDLFARDWGIAKHTI